MVSFQPGFARSRASTSCSSSVMMVSSCQSNSPILRPMIKRKSLRSLFIRTDASRLPYVSAATPIRTSLSQILASAVFSHNGWSTMVGAIGDGTFGRQKILFIEESLSVINSFKTKPNQQPSTLPLNISPSVLPDVPSQLCQLVRNQPHFFSSPLFTIFVPDHRTIPLTL